MLRQRYPRWFSDAEGAPQPPSFPSQRESRALAFIVPGSGMEDVRPRKTSSVPSTAWTFSHIPHANLDKYGVDELHHLAPVNLRIPRVRLPGRWHRGTEGIRSVVVSYTMMLRPHLASPSGPRPSQPETVPDGSPGHSFAYRLQSSSWTGAPGVVVDGLPGDGQPNLESTEGVLGDSP